MKWVEPDVFVTCPDGAKVYHSYKNDDYENAFFWGYTTEHEGEQEEFDVRDIPRHRCETQGNTPSDDEVMGRVRLLGWAMDCWAHHVSLAELIFNDEVTYEMVTERV
jgi:hypothetical protein